METASTLCPKHPNLTAVMTCARCGTFACMTCRSVGDERLCADCGERYAAASFDVGSILQDAFNLLLRNPLAVAVFCGAQVAFGLAMMPLATAMGVDGPPDASTMPEMSQMLPLVGASLLATLVYTSIAYAVFIRYLGNALEGSHRSIGEVVRTGLGHAPSLIILNFLLGMIIGIGYALCVVPGIYLTVGLLFAVPALVLDSVGPFEAISTSWERTTGYRWRILLLLIVSGITLFGVGLLGGIGALILEPLGPWGKVVSTMVQQSFSGLGVALFLAFLALGHLRLSGRWLPTSRVS